MALNSVSIILHKKGSSSAYDEARFLKYCVKCVLAAGKSSAGPAYSGHILIVVDRYLRHYEAIQGIFIGKLLFLVDLTLELLVKRLNYVRGVDRGADCLRKVVELLTGRREILGLANLFELTDDITAVTFANVAVKTAFANYSSS